MLVQFASAAVEECVSTTPDNEHYSILIKSMDSDNKNKVWRQYSEGLRYCLEDRTSSLFLPFCMFCSVPKIRNALSQRVFSVRKTHRGIKFLSTVDCEKSGDCF